VTRCTRRSRRPRRSRRSCSSALRWARSPCSGVRSGLIAFHATSPALGRGRCSCGRGDTCRGRAGSYSPCSHERDVEVRPVAQVDAASDPLVVEKERAAIGHPIGRDSEIGPVDEAARPAVRAADHARVGGRVDEHLAAIAAGYVEPMAERPTSAGSRCPGCRPHSRGYLRNVRDRSELPDLKARR